MKNFLFLLPLLILFTACPPEDPKPASIPREIFALRVGEFQLSWSRAHTRIYIWINSIAARDQKEALEKFVTVDYINIKQQLVIMKENGTIWQNDDVGELCARMDSLAGRYKYIMNLLSDYKNYDDPAIMLEVRSLGENPDGACETNYAFIDEKLESIKSNIIRLGVSDPTVK